MDPRMPWKPFNIEFLLTLAIPTTLIQPQSLLVYNISPPYWTDRHRQKCFYHSISVWTLSQLQSSSNSSSSKSNSSINFWLPSPAKHVYLWGQPQIEVNRIPFNCQQFPCCAAPNQPPAEHTRFHWAGATSVIVWSMANRKYKFVQFIAKITTTKHSTGVWWRNPVDNTAQPQTQSIAATRHYQSWCSASWWWWWWTTYTRQHGLNPVTHLCIH